MTKLMQWLLGGFIFLVIWLSMIKNIFSSHLVEEWMQVVLGLPIILIGLFGMYAASVVLWRVYTFNDCEEAAKELQQQILEAREELSKRGFVFEEVDKKKD